MHFISLDKYLLISKDNIFRSLNCYCENSPIIKCDLTGQASAYIYSSSDIHGGGGRSSGGGAGRRGFPSETISVTENAIENPAENAVDFEISSYYSSIYLTSSPTIGWKVGDPLNNFTAKGNIPEWSTIRQRFWKNEAFYNLQNYSVENQNG